MANVGRLCHLVDFVDAKWSSVMNGNCHHPNHFRHILRHPWLVSSNTAHQLVTQCFSSSPLCRTPTEHRNRLAIRFMIAQAQLPKRPAAGIADSFHSDIAGQPGADLPLRIPEKTCVDLSFWIENRSRKCYFNLLRNFVHVLPPAISSLYPALPW